MARSESGPAPDDVPGEDYSWEDISAEAVYAQGRVPERTYASKTFKINQPSSQDHGQPARFIYKVFDPDAEYVAALEGEEWVLRRTPRGRYQLKLLVAREAGVVKQLLIQRIPTSGPPSDAKVLLSLGRNEAQRLITLLRNLAAVPIEGQESTRVDDSILRQVLEDPEAFTTAYKRHSNQFRQVIADDIEAKDVLAIAYRRAQVSHFRRLLEDDAFFEQQRNNVPSGKREAVWQDFFERNPWIFGVSLAGQMLTAWNPQKLEQVIAGFSIAGPGKRADAVLRTAGLIRSMVFVEVKTHLADLLKQEYRSGCWSPSDDLAGAVAQTHGTVHAALNAIGDKLSDRDEDGGEIPGQATHLIRPRSFLIVGHLQQLMGRSGGVHQDKYRSFELYRRNLVEPEIITFDELLRRAEWHVERASDEAQ